MQQILSVVETVTSKGTPMVRIDFICAYGLNLERRLLDEILYEIDICGIPR
jgi:hypothetical protein